MARSKKSRLSVVSKPPTVMSALGSVSYTHLDVYKRQAPLSGTRLKSSNQAVDFFMTFLVYHDFLAILADWGMHLEAGF